MIRPSAAPSLDRFRHLIADRLGLAFDNARSGALAETLERRSRAHALEAASYLDQLERLQVGAAELSTLGAELTIGETYFFRHTEQMRAFAEVALPACRASVRGARPIRILSAGCASGEEAYTLAILANEQGLVGAQAPDIVGIDLNPRAVARAQRAQYSEWALRDTPEEARKRYFKKVGSAYLLIRDHLPTVRFRQGNLVDDDVLGRECFDVVFCRNVLMYFTRDQARRALRRLAAALAPGGYFFLGHAETLHGLSADFDLGQAHGAFFYVRKETLSSGEASSERAPNQGAEHRPATKQSSPSIGSSSTASWLDGVDRSSERIHALWEPKPARAEAPLDPGSATSLARGERAISRLIEAERWDEALELVNRSETAATDSEHMVLRAALLTHSGRFDSAEQLCLSILAKDELNAPAHYLLALLRERQGKQEVAIEHDEIAVELDPTFAMPELHRGLLWLRVKRVNRARTALERAVRLLEREDAWRVLLFGGGFQRAALIQLCERELTRLGGAT